MYVLMVFLFPISLRFGEDLIAHFFFILSFYQLLSIRQNDDARNNTFLSGLFLGAAATFLPIYVTFILLIWLGVFIMRPFVFREYLLPLVALVLPFLFNFEFLKVWRLIYCHSAYSNYHLGIIGQ